MNNQDSSLIITLIVAIARNGTIGKDGTLPWHIPADLKRYKARTLGKPLVMGRKTLESLYKEVGGPLKGRANIIVTRQNDYDAKDGVRVAATIEEAVKLASDIAKADGVDEIFINGGANVYKQALDSGIVDMLDLCLVHDDVAGDTVFPDYDKSAWLEIWREDHAAENGKPAFSFVQYKKRA